MTKNPCRGCEYSWIYKGRSYPGFKRNDDGDTVCYCDKYYKHKHYLLSKRKFIAGDVISSFEEFNKQEWIIWDGMTKHISAIMNMPYWIVSKHLKNGHFRYAIRRAEVETQ